MGWGAVKEGLLEKVAVNLDLDKSGETENDCCAICLLHKCEQGLWAVGTQWCSRPDPSPHPCSGVVGLISRRHSAAVVQGLMLFQQS